MSQKKGSNHSQDVITIRIDHDLSDNLNKIKERLGISKADLIRNYLDMSKFMIKQKGSIKSLNNRDFIIVKRSYVKKLIENMDDDDQELRKVLSDFFQLLSITS
ncbi:MAG: ribbon-helix-helix protein, CopG family, partial [Promethearchaeota archaeon]